MKPDTKIKFLREALSSSLKSISVLIRMADPERI